MRIPDRDQFDSLMKCREPYCLSLMMPTHPSGDQWQEDRIRFKNLMQKAHDDLKELGMNTLDIDARLNEYQVLVGDKAFWKDQREGLCLFVGCNVSELFSVPIELDEAVVVGSHFHLKPIIPLLTNDFVFHILALSRKDVRLFKATRYDVRQVSSDRIPSSFEEAMAEIDPERQVQFHSGTQGHGRGRRPAVFHGQGGDEDQHDRTGEFCRMIDKGVRATLGNGHAPFVVVATEPMKSSFRNVSDLPDDTVLAVDKNPDPLSPAQLHAASVCQLAGRFRGEARRARDEFMNIIATDRAVLEPEEVLKDVYSGQAAMVLASADNRLWGTVSDDGLNVEVHDQRQLGDEDLLNVALVQGYCYGATPWVLPRHDMPNEKSLVAALHGEGG